MGCALAIETSSRIGSVALVEDGKVIVEEHFPHGLKHAAEMIPMIDRLCAQRGWGPADFGEVYVSAGPGSFTGLRIGITLAKTMALARGVKIVAVPTVRVLAENVPTDARELVIVLDAKREQIFTARFERDGIHGGWIERETAHLDTLTAVMQRAGRPVYLIGEGIPFHEKYLDKGDTGVVVMGEETWRPRAGAVARIGIEMARAGEYADAYRLVPIYVRKAEAEERWEARQNQ
jgi:tRNA threonylcarbamoyladenosine biosynthesis protein TsaB